MNQIQKMQRFLLNAYSSTGSHSMSLSSKTAYGR